MRRPSTLRAGSRFTAQEGIPLKALRPDPRPRYRLPGSAAGVGVLSLASLALLAAPAFAQERLTLEQAIDMALVRSPIYVQAELAVANASESRRTALGAFLPSVSASSGGTMRPGNAFDPTTGLIVSTTNRSLSGGVSASIDLYNGGRSRADFDRAGVDLEAADVRLEGQRFQVIYQTKQLYFSALRQAELLRVAEARVARAGESLSLVRQRVLVGTATSSDSLRARLELANAQQAALQTETQLRSAQMSLGRQVGLGTMVEAVSLGVIEAAPLPLSQEEIFRLAEAASPTVRSAELVARSTESQVTSARSAYLPTARLATSYNWSNGDWAFDGGSGNWGGLSLSLSYSIFNGFVREASVERAQNQLRLSRLQLDDARLQARQEVDAALYSIRNAERAVAIAEEAVLVAQEDLRVVTQRYEVGVATVFEVITSQISLDQAEVDRVSTRYDYLLARAQLESILGREL